MVHTQKYKKAERLCFSREFRLKIFFKKKSPSINDTRGQYIKDEKNEQNEVEDFKSGEKYIQMKALHLKEIQNFKRTILKMQDELARAHSAMVSMREHWFEVFEDLQKEFEQKLKEAEHQLKKMEERAHVQTVKTAATVPCLAQS